MTRRRQRSSRGILLLLCLVSVTPVAARAQATNVSVFEDLARGCLAGAPDTLRAFRLDAPAQMPYVRAALAAAWQTEGRRVYVSDTSAIARALPVLAYRIESVGVAYARAGRRRAARSLSLALRYTVTEADGRLLAEDGCSETFGDTLALRALASVETASYPETMAEHPPAGWLRRYLEPALLTAATAVGVYLFFTLRSQATE